MLNVRRILVAIKDPTAGTLHALDKAIQLGRAFGASLELYHAITDPVYMDFELTERSLRQVKDGRLASYGKELESLAARAREQGLSVSTSVEWDFPSHEAIVRRAARVKADLIVAECHQGRRLAPWLVHLTDWELLRTSPIPVLLVRSSQPYEHPIVLAAVDPTHAHAKPAKLDAAIFEAGAKFTNVLGGSLHAMHAYLPITMDGPITEIAGDSLRERIHAKVSADFERAVKKARIPRARRHLVIRNPVDAIPSMARTLGADLVVMGAISRSGLKRVFIGNTAERALGGIHCDVLVVKPRRFASRVARKPQGLRLVTPQIPYAY